MEFSMVVGFFVRIFNSLHNKLVMIVISRGKQLTENQFYCMWAYQKQSLIKQLIIELGGDATNPFEFLDTVMYVYNNCPWIVERKEMQLNWIMAKPEWTEPNEEGIINMPDELDKLFHKVGMQLRFHTISGKNEFQTIVDIVAIAQQYFKENPKALEVWNSTTLNNTNHLVMARPG